MARYDEPGFVSRLPGLDMDAHDNAMTAAGSNPPRTPPPDARIDPAAISAAQDGITYTLAGPPGSGKSASPQMAGQTDPSVITPVAPNSITSTGAGGGEAIVDSSYRYDWQQRPQGG
jgi:hypothetical protein